MKKARLAGVLAALALSGAAQAELFDRGGSRIYDDVLNVTWMADFKFSKATGFDADGLMTWNQAQVFVDSLEFGGYSDWRMPSALNADGSGPCVGLGCTGGELGHLFFNELGVTPGTSILTADPAKLALFRNVDLNGLSWTGTDYPDSDSAVFFTIGGQGFFYKEGRPFFPEIPVVAVRDGDVGAVPEPETGAMMLLALGAMMLSLRQRRFAHAGSDKSASQGMITKDRTE